MRISILQGAFLPVPPLRGGAIEKAWEALGQEFSRMGHKVTHFSRWCDGLPQKEMIGKVAHHRLKGADTVTSPWLQKILEIPYVLRARRVLPEADVLVTHAFWAPLLFPKQSRGKLYLHVGRFPKGQMRFYSKASRFQVPSGAIAEAVRREIPSRKNRVSVLPYPLGWPLPKINSFADRPKQCLYAGRLHPEKGVLQLVDAFVGLSPEKRAGWELRILGPWRKDQGGGGRQYLEKLKSVEKESMGSVRILEPVFSSEELIDQYLQTRLFIYPSLAEKGETFGLAVLEAMSCGCVPLVSDLACFKDFVRPKVNGFVFDAARRDAFGPDIQKKLESIFLESSGLEALSAQARKESSGFELNSVASRYLEDFSEMLA